MSAVWADVVFFTRFEPADAASNTVLTVKNYKVVRTSDANNAVSRFISSVVFAFFVVRQFTCPDSGDIPVRSFQSQI